MDAKHSGIPEQDWIPYKGEVQISKWIPNLNPPPTNQLQYKSALEVSRWQVQNLVSSGFRG